MTGDLNRWYHPSDIDKLRMENELLTFEVEYLRNVVAEKGRSSQQAATADALGISSEETEELKQARSDLRWVLRRLDGSPIGWILRRRQGFASLTNRWL
jgi:hypothetical protein